ncbi:peptidase S8 [Amycolatopsis sp. NPDC051061]|uniref:S53 family peptidase n=1 Tax=Amycolatopsis sp. NPDC051061 TaxID=3155042 RepID=UPI00344711A0
MSRTFVRSAVLGAALVAAMACIPVAQAAADPHAVTSQVQSLREQVRNGTLLKSHSTIESCAFCQAKAVTTAPGSETLLSTTVPVGYGADDLAAAYHLPDAGSGAKGTIAIIDAGVYPNLEADLATYRTQYGLPPCTAASGCLKVVDQHGGPALTPATEIPGVIYEEHVALETALDMQMASAACPTCNLIELQVPIEDAIAGDAAQDHAAMADFGDAVNTAARLGANAVSISYQFPGYSDVEFGKPGLDLFHPGMAILASSGDSGYQGNQHTGWPQNLPWVVSVGGTSLLQSGSKYTDIVWSDAGSGCETDLPGAIGAPPAVSASCGGHRASSDVSAVADAATGVAVFDSYSPFSGQPFNWLIVGGTSASSPFVSGLYARGGHTSQVLGPNTLYTAPAGAFTDVTLGQNAPAHVCPAATPALCVAQPGWDAPTGVGVPNGLSGF